MTNLEKITENHLHGDAYRRTPDQALLMQKLEAGFEKEDYIDGHWESARVRKEKAVLAWEIAERDERFLEETGL